MLDHRQKEIAHSRLNGFKLRRKPTFAILSTNPVSTSNTWVLLAAERHSIFEATYNGFSLLTLPTLLLDIVWWLFKICLKGLGW